MVRFEHKLCLCKVAPEIEMQELLDSMGSDGWELVTVVRPAAPPIVGPVFERLYFKRKVD